ncbi:MAG: gamma-glutamyl-gamma-aminobutyrate hydrolase family protein [Omnitrophica bacterium]|nr:gamma-glutamyl-gamma-aminobutyrate hydrolase family protein [Candidatus Omnitrophota bacterium]
MRIGITTRVVRGEGYPEERDAISRDWPEYIGSILPNAILVPLCNEDKKINRIIRHLELDGIILSGGNDWGETTRRDKTEANILKVCLRYRLPLLGVCRGMQVLNILFGGKLEKDIQKVSGKNHAGATHTIDLIKESKFFTQPKKRKLKVNSFHNQGIVAGGLSREFNVFAVTPGGVVEGICHSSRPIIGIQWHPERKNPAAFFDRRLIRTLFNT